MIALPITIVLVFKFLIGLAIGSFINVLALRYPFWNFWGRSHCLHCRKNLSWQELIPVFSFLIQRGRCRSCKAKISLQYPIVELLAGIGAVILPVYFLIPSYILLLTSLIDFRLQVIPDELSAALGWWGAGAIFLFGASWLNHLVAAAGAAAFLGSVILFTKGRGMGFGDLKLGAALGLWLGFPKIAFSLWAAFIIGAAWGVFLLLAKKKNLKDAIPFGPFLALGALITLFIS